MPRTTPPDRMAKLLEAASAAFVEHGFQRTQMDDIAVRLGVSKGTIYRAVASKESLFAAVIASGDAAGAAPGGGFTGASDLASVAASVAAELTTAVTALELTTIVAERRQPPAGGFGREVERVVDGLYQVMKGRRTAIMVLDRCAAEMPELAAVWFGDGRYALVDLWHEYLSLRSPHLTVDVDPEILARTIVEMITTWAVKILWDPAPRPYTDDTATACASMVRQLLAGPTR